VCLSFVLCALNFGDPGALLANGSALAVVPADADATVTEATAASAEASTTRGVSGSILSLPGREKRPAAASRPVFRLSASGFAGLSPVRGTRLEAVRAGLPPRGRWPPRRRGLRGATRAPPSRAAAALGSARRRG